MRVHLKNLSAAGLATVAIMSPVTGSAASLKLVADGFTNPLFATSAGDARLFVAEQGGRIAAVSNGVTTTFMTVPKIVTGGEKGLLGLAFDPGFATNRRFFVNVTAADKQGRLVTEIRRYTAFANDPTLGNPQSGVVIMRFLQPFENHNGGWLGFGKDGFLYIATGDGGSGNDPQNNGQSLKTRLGKILRIDVSGSGFKIPPGNPFATTAGAQKSIFHYGLRNPYRASFDRLTGEMFIADVGQNTREEIDFVGQGQNGLNFGWRLREGLIATPGVGGPLPNGATDPIYDYVHGNDTAAGQGNSVTGGYVYRGSSTPELTGRYVFGDFVSGGLWSITYDRVLRKVTNFTNLTALLAPFGGANISSFGEDNAGELYVVDYRGRVLKFQP